MTIHRQFPMSFMKVNSPVPTLITDNFASDSGEWLNGALAPAAITVSSNKGSWTPTFGDEMHVDANAASDPATNEANATTGWTVSGATIASENTDVNTGSYALLVTGTGASGRAYSSYTVEKGQWILLSAATKRQVAGDPSTLQTQYGVPDVRVSPTTTWTQYYLANAATGTTWRASLLAGAADKLLYADNISIKPINHATMFRLRRIYYPSSVSAKTTTSPGHAGLGVVLFHDINNYIVAYQGFTSIRRMCLLKCVAGVVSEASANVSYSYGLNKTLTLTPNADFNTFSVTYDGVAAFTNVAITDFENTPGPWYAGLFLTRDTGSLTTTAFSTFVAERVANAPLFSKGNFISESIEEVV